MARRLKTTPFARFLVALLFIVPLAYIGASFYNGEDPIQQIKDKLGIASETTETYERQATLEEETDTDTYDLREELESLKERIRELEMENAALKEKVRQLEMNQ